MASKIKAIRFWLKVVAAILALLLGATYGVIVSVILTLARKNNLAQWSTARFFYHLFSKLFNIKIVIDHPERLEKLPGILISNHQSELDIFMLGRVFPKKCVVTAKKQLKYVPFLGWFMSLSGTFFLDRSNREKALSTLHRALEELKSSEGGLFMFPEGTRSYATDPKLLPFKKGAFHLAVQAQIPIIPIAVSNTSTVYSPKTKTFSGGVINIKVLEPISTEGLTKEDVPHLVEKVQKQMDQAIQELGFSETTDGIIEAPLSPEVEIGTSVEPETETDANEETTLLAHLAKDSGN
ncbi:unnamed protein product [Kuraishia capsulata CBS 1993]|uniref:1-acyl-sn-glycerol-3-phosphate acyltransferase n=1 Tax=Kuraishia capsulata CBS 1993 TaxID=1382522 RepID=W6MLR9_9ASCO|nr:uncharacterized protein KUCA_T00001782001 [Kuraishia capsulata CBS 1993]CDK25812.1 unnamed protein product [Kuraishia capsulata CBS 1993]